MFSASSLRQFQILSFAFFYLWLLRRKTVSSQYFGAKGDSLSPAFLRKYFYCKLCYIKFCIHCWSSPALLITIFTLPANFYHKPCLFKNLKQFLYVCVGGCYHILEHILVRHALIFIAGDAVIRQQVYLFNASQ